RGAATLDQEVGQAWAGGDAVDPVAICVRCDYLLGRGGKELGLVVVDYVCTSAAVVEPEQRVDGLPASRDHQVGALPILEALVHGPLEFGEVLPDFLTQHRWPDRAGVVLVVSEPHAAC